jgi:hypothetical protein
MDYIMKLIFTAGPALGARVTMGDYCVTVGTASSRLLRQQLDAAPGGFRDGEARVWMGSEGPLLIEPRKKSDKWTEVTGTLGTGAESEIVIGSRHGTSSPRRS